LTHINYHPRMARAVPSTIFLFALCATGWLAPVGVHAADGRTLGRSTVPSSDRANAAADRVRPALERELAAQDLRFGAPAFVRIFKAESELELWLARADGTYALFRTWPICTWSGALGPKVRQGDGQSPEGFYRVAAHQLNPASRFHLAFNLGYPNAYDRAHARTGDFLMVHGNCVSIGCDAMGDAAIEEIYTLVAAALARGQPAFEVHAFPFRFADADDERFADERWGAFWRELSAGYFAFERTHVPPRVAVVDGRYAVVDASPASTAP
jgi:murein L,D-transpeptidase YafK